MLNLLPLTCIVLAALASASAVPTSDPKPKQCKPRGKEKVYTASYDDLPFTEGDQPPTPIGDDYLGLKYTNFYVDAFDGFIVPASFPNVAISYDCAAPRSISVARAGDSFDLRSTYVACSAGFPQADCRTTVTGVRRNGRTVSQEVVFPALDSSQPFVMTRVEFGRKWRDLVSVSFGRSLYVDEYGEERCAAFTVDDFTYAKKDCV